MYVIGGIVDRTVQKNMSLLKAENMNVSLVAVMFRIVMWAVMNFLSSVGYYQKITHR